MAGTAFVRTGGREAAARPPRPVPPTERKETPMRTPLATAPGLVLALALAATARAQDTADRTPEALLGTYTIVSGEDSGRPVPDERIEGSKIRITPDVIVSTDRDGKELYVAKFRLNTDARPWKIVMTMSGGPRGQRGDQADGIIELDGDTVRLAYAPEGGVVPTKFDTKTGPKQILFVLRRIPEGTEAPK